MKVVSLSSVTEKIFKFDPRSAPDETFTYIDIGSVDSKSKVILSPSQIYGADAPSRARQIISTGDVLVSTVRPNLNAVAAVNNIFDNSIASTGFSVLRPSQNLNTRYLFHWLTSPNFIESMSRRATGASYPAVSDKIVKSSSIPLPSLNEQRRIAGILDEADAIRSKRLNSLPLFDELRNSVFKSRFGDLTNLNSHLRLGDVAELEGGRNIVAKDLTGDAEYRVLKISAVTSGTFRPQESKPLPAAYIPPEKHFVRPGDLLISRANTEALVGAVAYVSSTFKNLVLPDKIWRISFKDHRSSSLYYREFFQMPSTRRAISQMASGTGGSMKNISKSKLLNLKVLSVGHIDQAEFAAHIEQINAQRALVEKALEKDEELFASLQSRAFRGEL